MDALEEQEDASVELKKAQKLEFMRQREIQRKNKLQEDRTKSAGNKCETEKTGFILSKFDETHRDLLSIMEKTENCPDNSDEGLQMLRSCYDKLDELHRIITTSAHFISNFHTRKFHEHYHLLEEKCQQLEQRFRPRKKFGFNANRNNVCRKKLGRDDEKNGLVIIPNGNAMMPILNGSSADGNNSKLIQNGDGVTDTVDNRIATTKTSSSSSRAMLDEQQTVVVGFHGKKLEKLRMDYDQVNAKDVQLTKLEYCQVKIYGCPATLYMTLLENCEIFCGPTFASVFIESCRNCTFVLACQQLRVHSTVACKFYSYVTSRTVVESCKELQFAAYAWKYNRMDDHFEETFHGRPNQWNLIDDFDWLSNDIPSPNWSFIDSNDRICFPND